MRRPVLWVKAWARCGLESRLVDEAKSIEWLTVSRAFDVPSSRALVSKPRSSRRPQEHDARALREPLHERGARKSLCAQLQPRTHTSLTAKAN